jgi:phosphatidate cytidylyltransferase
MSQRIVTAVVLLPILVASIWIERLAAIFIIFALVAMCFGLWEFWRLARRFDPDLIVGGLFALLLFAIFLIGRLDLLPAAISSSIIAVLIARLLRGAPFDSMIASSGATLLGLFYVVGLGGHLVAVRMGFEAALAAKLLSFFLLVIMGSDTAAYYVGRAWGRRKLAPTVSPGKSWEGAIGGMLASLCAAVVAHYWFFVELPLRMALPLAAAMNVLGVFGDLTESALKRGSGAKDAANILPGHGGFLDRLDSLLFNAPLIYYFGKLYFA